MNNYVKTLNADLLSYLIKKMIIYLNPIDVCNFVPIDINIQLSLSNDIVYLQCLDHIPEMKFSYNRFVNNATNWLSKYLLFKTLINLVPFVDNATDLLTLGMTPGNNGLYVNTGHNTLEFGTIASLDYLKVPGIDYNQVEDKILRTFGTWRMEYRCPEVVIGELKNDIFKVAIILFNTDKGKKVSSFGYLLNKSQLRILLAGILYSNITITDNQSNLIFE